MISTQPHPLATPEQNRSRLRVTEEYRGWELCWLPGYQIQGHQQYAFCGWKRKSRYYIFTLQYFELDHHCPYDTVFNDALERVGPDLSHELWVQHYDEFSRLCSFSHGGWRWWYGSGLSLPFILELRAMIQKRYEDACSLYQSWPVPEADRYWPSWTPPEEDPGAVEERESLEKQSEQRASAILALKPKPRPYRPPKETPEQARLRELWIIEDRKATCPFCGMTYVEESITDRAQHRRFHPQVASTLPPRPDDRISALTLKIGADLTVERSSPAWMQTMVYERARRLQQEEHYDFVQWSEDGPNWKRSPEYPTPPHAILLIERGNIAVGVVGFQTGQFWSNICPGWHMLFVWVAPEWRRQAVLSRRWPAWRAAYGEFTVETPISSGMASFLAKVNHPLEKFTTANPKIQSWSYFS